MVQKLKGMWINRMPTVDDQCGRSGSGVGNVLMQSVEVVREGLSRELKLQQLATDPLGRPAQAAVFPCHPVDLTGRQLVAMPGRRYGRVSQE
ncbi:hypothetical protein AWC31_09150 [Mycolicibacterium wolinskyi]|uniref:Uncharacterized protein n=1 Tax=Mycolicibacterium wolinskyi TaxID=59750 RepID=A0A1X2ESF6_9MYCO|nr:hypothetical protein AWC31_09150 [Mycolicibacterium wolinskyi]